MALLVLLAAATWAGIVPADAGNLITGRGRTGPSKRLNFTSLRWRGIGHVEDVLSALFHRDRRLLQLFARFDPDRHEHFGDIVLDGV